MKKGLLLQREEKRPFHAYLFLAEEESAEEAIKDLVNRLEIKTVDLFVLDPSGKIKIQQIRELQHQINLKPHSSKYKMVLIKKAQNLTPEASNALLKTLEEPPKDSILILLAKETEELLPTIVSRCRKIKIKKPIKIEVPPEDRQLLKDIPKMSVKEKFDLANQLSKEEQLVTILDKWLSVFREELLKGQNRKKIIQKIQESQKLLRKNVNLRLLLENLLLEIE